MLTDRLRPQPGGCEGIDPIKVEYEEHDSRLPLGLHSLLQIANGAFVQAAFDRYDGREALSCNLDAQRQILFGSPGVDEWPVAS